MGSSLQYRCTHNLASFFAGRNDELVAQQRIEQITHEWNESEDECPAESEAADVETLVEVVCSSSYLGQ